VLTESSSMRDRIAMYGNNKLKLGLIGMNCSSARAMTTVPERWPMTWRDNLEVVRAADDAGIDFVLPIGRWKGYGGDTDHQGETFETLTWASGLLAATRHITVFGTVHAPLVHPLSAAKQCVTADHIGEGRFALNVVVGWNAGEFEMFGVERREHDRRYAFAQEWLDVVKAAWTNEAEFDFDGEFLHLKHVRAKPKPYGGSRPVIMNAGASGTGRDFALRNCEAYFTGTIVGSLESAARSTADVRSAAKALGREVAVFTAGDVVCRSSRREAEEYARYCFEENVDWAAVDTTMALRHDQVIRDTDQLAAARRETAKHLAGFSMIGTPDDVTAKLAQVSAAGFDGIGFSFVHYGREFPYFRDEVLPRLERLGLREPYES
jgi:FMNH2-dependent dimethyl sulfone monooxygenase